MLLKQAQAFISHVHVSVCCVLLQGPTGPERQFCSIYKGTTAAFLPDLMMFHIPRSPAFGPCRVLGCPIFLMTRVLREPCKVRTIKSHFLRSTSSVGEKRLWAKGEKNLCREMALLA